MVFTGVLATAILVLGIYRCMCSCGTCIAPRNQEEVEEVMQAIQQKATRMAADVTTIPSLENRYAALEQVKPPLLLMGRVEVARGAARLKCAETDQGLLRQWLRSKQQASTPPPRQ